jgi:hypothetical protein
MTRLRRGKAAWNPKVRGKIIGAAIPSSL